MYEWFSLLDFYNDFGREGGWVFLVFVINEEIEVYKDLLVIWLVDGGVWKSGVFLILRLDIFVFKGLSRILEIFLSVYSRGN